MKLSAANGRLNAFPRIHQSSRAVVAMPKVLQVLCCKGNEFPLTSRLNFSLFLPQLTQPMPGRLTLINCSLNYLGCAVECNVLQRHQLPAALEISHTDRRLPLCDSSLAFGVATYLPQSLSSTFPPCNQLPAPPGLFPHLLLVHKPLCAGFLDV